MLLNTYDIVLDISEQNYINSGISLVQNDAKVNQFSIKLFDGNTEIDYDEVNSASITFYKLDGNVVQGNLVKTETGFTYDLGTNEIAAPGIVYVTVQLMGEDGERLTTSKFSIEVVKDLINDTAVESTTEFAILQQLKAELEAINVVALTNKVGTGTLETTAQNCVAAINEVNTAVDEINTDFENYVAQNDLKSTFHSTADLTYYVRPDGSDTNDGSANDLAHAFLTIAKAISMIPQVLNHVATINIAPGTYTESVNIIGIIGKGQIKVIGAANVTDAANHVVTGRIYLSGCQLSGISTIQGIKTTYESASGTSIRILASSTFSVQYCRVEPANYVAGASGIWVYSASGLVSNNVISNMNYAISSMYGNVVSSNNTGSNNTVALYATSAATLGKSGTQPTATTAEQTATGGIIRA